MNANGIINMVVRLIMRRVVGRGINAGIDAASRKFTKGDPGQDQARQGQHPARRQAPQQGGDARQMAKRSRQAMKVARRIGRM